MPETRTRSFGEFQLDQLDALVRSLERREMPGNAELAAAVVVVLRKQYDRAGTARTE